MAWSAEKRAIVLLARPTATDPAKVIGYVAATSTSTIRPRRSREGVVLFGLSPGGVQWKDTMGNNIGSSTIFGSASTVVRSGDPCGLGEDVVYYLRESQLSGEHPIVLPSDPAAPPLRRTCVSTGDRFVPDDRAVVVLDDSGATRAVTTVEHYTFVKDPCVVRLGDSGKWAMLLVRERTTYDADRGMFRSGSGANGSLSDIVAYLSDVPTFDDPGSIVGPLWLVSGLRAFPDNHDARYWLGVPTGVVAHNSLYVWFVAEPSGLDPATNPLADPSPGTATYPAGIAVSRFRLDDLLGAPPKPEDRWESDVLFRDMIVRGTPLGPARFWFAGNLPYPRVVAFEEVFSLPQLVDPDVGWCEDEFSLYVAAISTEVYKEGVATVSRGQGFGIWRSSPVDGSETLIDDTANAAFTTIFGVDFVLDAVWDATGAFLNSDDLIAESTDDRNVYVDPDVVDQRDGKTRVMAGAWNKTTLPSTTINDTVMFVGDDTDACRPWDTVWRDAVGAQAPAEAAPVVPPVDWSRLPKQGWPGPQSDDAAFALGIPALRWPGDPGFTNQESTSADPASPASAPPPACPRCAETGPPPRQG